MFRFFWRFRRMLERYRRSLAGGSVLVLVAAMVKLALPWPLKVVVDDVLEGQPASGAFGAIVEPITGGDVNRLLIVCAVSLAALAGVGALADYLSERTLSGVGERMLADLRTTTFAHLQRLSLSYHDRQKVGDLTERMTSDSNTMQGLLVAALSTFAPNVVLMVGILVITVLIDPGFAILALTIAPLLFAVVVYYRRRIKAASRDARRHEGSVASHVNETLSSIRLVQSYAAEGDADDRFATHTDARLQAGLRRVDYAARLPAVIDVIAQSGRALVLLVGAQRVLSGQMTLGVLLVFLAYLQQLYAPMKSLAKLTTTVSKGLASAERVEEVLAAEAVVRDRRSAIATPPLRGVVELRNVSFGYDPERPVLTDVSMLALPGETVALVGPTGAGKSTILGLIPRLHDPVRGEVRIDGADVRSYRLQSLREQVALVLQESVLLSGTILDNIAFGSPEASERQLLAAAEAAYVDEFVDRLPDRYDTVVSERGTTLSGGQRQRIAIARALVRDAPIVVLDEPTSGLDALSEQLVMQGLERLTAGRTVIVVAHRLSTLHRADRIYVVDGGKIVDTGTHEQLSAREGVYGRMAAALVGPAAAAAPPLPPPQLPALAVAAPA
ncbi:MAG: ABC transporter ATP-binding protein [Ilumatobacteraceae bacterium]